MTLEMAVAFALLLGALVLFASERFPVELVALMILAVMLVLGPFLGLTVAEVVGGFGNPATVTILAMFILSGAIARTGVINWLAGWLSPLMGRGERRQLVSMMLVVGGISAFLNNTATVAILLPMVMTLAREQKRAPSKLLIPLSFGAQLGGVITLIGTSTNILASSVAAAQGYGGFGMFDFTLIGLLVFAVGLLYFVLIGHRLLPERQAGQSLADSYQLKAYLAEIRILPGSPLVGRSLAESQLSRQVDVQVLDIIRGEQHLAPLHGDTVLQAGDVLLVQANSNQLLHIQGIKGISITPDLPDEKGQEMGLLEVVVGPGSDLIGGTLESTNFRNRFNCSVVAIRKHGRVLHERLSSVSLELGDALLLHGTPYALEQLKREPAFIVTEQAPLATFRREKIPIALGIILGVVGVAGMGVPILVTAMVGSVLTVLTGCLKVNEIHESIRWDVIFLLAGVLPLGLALERTGAAQWVADLAVQLAGSVSPLFMLMIFYAAAALLTEFISNNATVVVLAPIAGATATALGLRPSAFILAIMFAASTSFMTPIGYQTNTMVYGPGGYKFLDFFRVGALLNLVLALTTPVFIWLFWGL